MSCLLCHELYAGEAYVLHEDCRCGGDAEDCDHLLGLIEGKLGINVTPGELERHMEHAKRPVTHR